jgi:hypothetical protein
MESNAIAGRQSVFLEDHEIFGSSCAQNIHTHGIAASQHLPLIWEQKKMIVAGCTNLIWNKNNDCISLYQFN